MHRQIVECNNKIDVLSVVGVEKMRFKSQFVVAVALGMLLAACGRDTPNQPGDVAFITDPYPSTYDPDLEGQMLIKNATILDGRGTQHDAATLVLRKGKVVAIYSGDDAETIAADIAANEPRDLIEVDAQGRWVTPGIIDNHSHLGVYPSPSVSAHNDGNEISAPVTPEVWAEHGVWPQDPGFSHVRAGGVTAMQILPGSANLFGGRGVTLKNIPSRTVQGMKFPRAPYTLKMACGENPKRVYGYGRGAFPGGAPYSRMGNLAGYRMAFAEAVEYKRAWDGYQKSGGKAPTRDLGLDTLKGVLEGDILVHMHCYRADEMAQIMDLADEFGFKITAFHHAVESYKIPDLLADHDVCSSMWADWWGFKMEAYDAIRENIPMVHSGGACAIVHSDSDIGAQRLNQEAAKALADGQAVGLDITKAEAWQWLSYFPAKSLGIDDATGSLEPGKMADVVLWSGDPFSVYTKADMVIIDGRIQYDRSKPETFYQSDFMLGQSAGDAS